MGWLVMWCVVFMATASAMVNYQSERRDQQEVDRTDALAWQMVVWHKALVAACIDKDQPGLCPDAGEVDAAVVKSHLGSFTGKGGVKYQFSAFKDTTVYDNRRFRSVVDPAERIAVTWYNLEGSALARDAGPIVAGLTVGQGWSAMMGRYDQASRRVDRVAQMAEDNATVFYVTVPTTIGSLIPDNVPVIVTRF